MFVRQNQDVVVPVSALTVPDMPQQIQTRMARLVPWLPEFERVVEPGEHFTSRMRWCS